MSRTDTGESGAFYSVCQHRGARVVVNAGGWGGGMHSRGFDSQLLGDDEVRLQHYHDWLNWWMAGRPPRSSGS